MATNKRPCDDSKQTGRSGLPPAYYHAHALLQTLRAIQCHEDELCTILTEIQRTGKVSSRTRRELIDALHELPLAALEAEVSAIFTALEEAAA